MKRKLGMRALLAVMALVLLCGAVGQAAGENGYGEPEKAFITDVRWSNVSVFDITQTDARL